MKKTYIQPTCVQVRIEATQMIASTTTPNQLGGKGGNYVSNDADCSRGGGFWDDED